MNELAAVKSPLPLGEGKGEGRRPCAADPRPHPGPLPRGEGDSRLPDSSTFLLDAISRHTTRYYLTGRGASASSAKRSSSPGALSTPRRHAMHPRPALATQDPSLLPGSALGMRDTPGIHRGANPPERGEWTRPRCTRGMLPTTSASGSIGVGLGSSEPLASSLGRGSLARAPCAVTDAQPSPDAMVVDAGVAIQVFLADEGPEVATGLFQGRRAADVSAAPDLIYLGCARIGEWMHRPRLAAARALQSIAAVRALPLQGLAPGGWVTTPPAGQSSMHREGARQARSHCAGSSSLPGAVV